MATDEQQVAIEIDYSPPLDSPLLTSCGTSSGYQTPSSSASSSLAFILVPNLQPSQPLQDMSKRPRPSFPLSATSPLRPPPTTTTMSMSAVHPLHIPQSFKPPQHKHAHHLHAIPPREKTTRTLILDHMLWLHAAARFAQVRAELGMNPDRAGSADDEDDWISFSDNESADGEKEKDAINAKAFKARADGLEKVLSAMLDQPPEELPFDSHDLLFRDTSFQPPPTSLPNGVRLRISLAGLINDIFAEDTVTFPREELETIPYYASAPPQLSSFTPALTALSRLSSFAHNNEIPVLPPFQSFAATADPNVHAPPAQSILPPPPPAGSIFSSIPRGAGPESPWALGSTSAARQTISSGPFSIPAVRSSAASTRFPTNANMPPPPPKVFRAVGRSRDLYNAGIYVPPTRSGVAGPSSSTSRPRRCPHHLTYACPPSSLCVSSLRAKSPARTSKSRTRSSIGAGLSSSGPPLRRAAFDGRHAGKDARMTDLLLRFLRLSALLAVELGSEAKGEEEGVEEVAKLGLGKRKESVGRARSNSFLGPNNEPVPSSGGSNGSYEDSDDDATSTGRRGSRVSARPTKLWYQLLAGLLTRSALQGYLVKGWKGTDPVEVLLGVGIGGTPPPATAIDGQAKGARPTAAVEEDDEEDDEEEKEYEPDDMPDLTETWHILFGFNADSQAAGAFENSSREALEEYERIMAERMSDVGLSHTPILHLILTTSPDSSSPCPATAQTSLRTSMI